MVQVTTYTLFEWAYSSGAAAGGPSARPCRLRNGVESRRTCRCPFSIPFRFSRKWLLGWMRATLKAMPLLSRFQLAQSGPEPCSIYPGDKVEASLFSYRQVMRRFSFPFLVGTSLISSSCRGDVPAGQDKVFRGSAGADSLSCCRTNLGVLRGHTPGSPSILLLLCLLKAVGL